MDADKPLTQRSEGGDQPDARGGGDAPPSRIQSAVGRTTTPAVPMDTEDMFDADEYNMKHAERGKAIIINNRNFHPRLNMSERTGTDQDASNLQTCFKQLDYDVTLKHNVTCAEMKDMMRKLAAEDHTNRDSFMCAILSHGEEGILYGIDGTIKIEDLTAPFKGDKCLSLAGKPKIFFIQACRGDRLDSGVVVSDAIGEEADMRKIPSEADFLIGYSVVPGYFSWRNSTRGSWFIQALCHVFNNFGRKLDLLSMMTRVNKIVAYDFESNASKEFMNKKKQIPCITSMLTKDVRFYSKYDD